MFDNIYELTEKAIITREKNNIDLLIEDRDRKKLFIIENKIKSFPSKEQLEKYKNQIEEDDNKKKLKHDKQYILATLFKPKCEGDKFGDWIIITYSKILENSNNLNLEFKDDDYRGIYKKYLEMLKNLVKLQELLTPESKDENKNIEPNDKDLKYDYNLVTETTKELNSIKFTEIYRKYYADRLLKFIKEGIREEFKEKIVFDENFKLKDYFNNKASYDYKKIYFYDETGLASKTSYTSFCFCINGFMIGIYIQNDQYRYILGVNPNKGELREKYAIAIYENNKLNFFNKNEDDLLLPINNRQPNFTPSFKYKELFCGFKKDGQYSLIYRYKKIKERNITFEDLKTAVLEDLTYIFEQLQPNGELFSIFSQVN